MTVSCRRGTFRLASFVAIAVLALGACTERDTGSIDLAGSSAASAPPPPHAPPCGGDEDCQGDPGKPFCDLAAERCVACLTDDQCEGGLRCMADFTCRR